MKHTNLNHKNSTINQNEIKEWSSLAKLQQIGILIVCRGPVRLEALEVFTDAGARCGILLSEKDSVMYTHTLAPELRFLEDSRVHRIPDYTGANSEERIERINQIIEIAKANHYLYIFAGYGFMAEDAQFVERLEDAGLIFVGPASSVHKNAGAKDTAKNIAREIKVSVTPGIDNITALTLLEKHGASKEKLLSLAKQHQLKDFDKGNISGGVENLAELAEEILQAGYKKGVSLISLEELQSKAQKEGKLLLKENPKYRLRLKCIGGGGGKGQRIVSTSEEIPNAIIEILSEAKVMGEADNKNFLMELNIENIRHNEIQLLGNGEWCVALGGRDCSLQIYEQKLVELSVSDELFQYEIENERKQGNESFTKVLEKDRKLFQEMEAQAVRFARAVKLNSASTFETIVTDETFYFMEMNTRIQVEHRVSEMIYALRFTNPENKNEFFDVESYLLAMVLVAVHGARLPCPQRIPRYFQKENVPNISGAEIRLNAQNEALQPSAGGLIEYWSKPHLKELRDDQGICLLEPDTGDFIRYYLAGAYDSNIALIVSYGLHGRKDNLENLAEVLRTMELRGQDLQTNKNFHYGIINFCLGLHHMLKPNTYFVQPYLCAVGKLAQELGKIDLDFAWASLLKKKILNDFQEEGVGILDVKQNLILRPLKLLQKNSHIAMGWLIKNFKKSFDFLNEKEKTGKLRFLKHPVFILRDLYHYLNLEKREGAVPIQEIWKDDDLLLQEGIDFYTQLFQELSLSTYDSNIEIEELVKKNPLYQKNEILVKKIIQTNKAWGLGFEILAFMIEVARQSKIFEFSIDDELRINVPSIFMDKQELKKSLRALAPPPSQSADTLVAQAGGMFYARETPSSLPYLKVGEHFKIGQPIYIIEVMKMFNKIYAEFSGTVTEVLIDIEKSQIVKKGQPLFKVTPDEYIEVETEISRKARIENSTKELWKIYQN